MQAAQASDLQPGSEQQLWVAQTGTVTPQGVRAGHPQRTPTREVNGQAGLTRTRTPQKALPLTRDPQLPTCNHPCRPQYSLARTRASAQPLEVPLSTAAPSNCDCRGCLGSSRGLSCTTLGHAALGRKVTTAWLWPVQGEVRPHMYRYTSTHETHTALFKQNKLNVCGFSREAQSCWGLGLEARPALDPRAQAPQPSPPPSRSPLLLKYK